MRESQVWHRVAEKIANDGKLHSGICSVVMQVKPESWRAFGLEVEHMDERIKYHIAKLDVAFDFEGKPEIPGEKNTGLWAYPRGEEVEARILAALWLELEAKEDEKVAKRQDNLQRQVGL